MTPALRWGSDESHFNVLLVVRGQSHKTESTDQNFVAAGNVGLGLYSYRRGL